MDEFDKLVAQVVKAQGSKGLTRTMTVEEVIQAARRVVFKTKPDLREQRESAFLALLGFITGAF